MIITINVNIPFTWGFINQDRSASISLAQTSPSLPNTFSSTERQSHPGAKILSDRRTSCSQTAIGREHVREWLKRGSRGRWDSVHSLWINCWQWCWSWAAALGQQWGRPSVCGAGSPLPHLSASQPHAWPPAATHLHLQSDLGCPRVCWRLRQSSRTGLAHPPATMQ